MLCGKSTYTGKWKEGGRLHCNPLEEGRGSLFFVRKDFMKTIFFKMHLASWYKKIMDWLCFFSVFCIWSTWEYTWFVCHWWERQYCGLLSPNIVENSSPVSRCSLNKFISTISVYLNKYPWICPQLGCVFVRLAMSFQWCSLNGGILRKRKEKIHQGIENEVHVYPIKKFCAWTLHRLSVKLLLLEQLLSCITS